MLENCDEQPTRNIVWVVLTFPKKCEIEWTRKKEKEKDKEKKWNMKKWK